MTRFNATFSSSVFSHSSLSSGTNSENQFSREQLALDAGLQNFSHEVSNWQSLAAMMAGGLAYRVTKCGVLSLGAAGRGSPLLGTLLAPVIGLGAEVTAFEGVNRSLSILRGGARENPNLLSWSGRGGMAEGLRDSFVTFGVMKSVGHAMRSHNIFLQHLSQDVSMVLGHEATARLGWTPAEQGSWLDRLVHAEATNLSIGMGMLLAHRLTGSRLQTFEQRLERQIEIRQTSHSENRAGMNARALPGMAAEGSRTAKSRLTFGSREKIEQSRQTILHHSELREVSPVICEEIEFYLNTVRDQPPFPYLRYSAVVQNRYEMMNGILDHLAALRPMVDSGELQRSEVTRVWHMVLGVLSKDCKVSAMSLENHPVPPFYLPMMQETVRQGASSVRHAIQTFASVVEGFQNYRQRLNEEDIFPLTAPSTEEVRDRSETSMDEEVPSQTPRPVESFDLRIQQANFRVEFYGEGFVPETQKQTIRQGLRHLLEKGENDFSLEGFRLEDGSSLVAVVADDAQGTMISRRLSNAGTQGRAVFNSRGLLEGILIQTPGMREYRLGEIPEARAISRPSMAEGNAVRFSEIPSVPVLEEAAAAFAPAEPAERAEVPLPEARENLEAVPVEAPAEPSEEGRQGDARDSEQGEREAPEEIPAAAQAPSSSTSPPFPSSSPSHLTRADYEKLGRGRLLGVDPRAQSPLQAQVRAREGESENRAERVERRSDRFEELAEELEMVAAIEALKEELESLETREEKANKYLDYLGDLMKDWQKEGLVREGIQNRYKIVGIYPEVQRAVIRHLHSLKKIITHNHLSSYEINLSDASDRQLITLLDLLEEAIQEVRNPYNNKNYNIPLRRRVASKRPERTAPVVSDAARPPEETVPEEVDLAVPVEGEGPGEIAERMKREESLLLQERLLEELAGGIELLEHAESQRDLSPEQVQALAQFKRVQKLSRHSLDSLLRVLERMRTVIGRLQAPGTASDELVAAVLAPEGRAGLVEEGISAVGEEVAPETASLSEAEARPLEAPATVMLPLPDVSMDLQVPQRASPAEVVERIFVTSPKRLLSDILQSAPERVRFLESYLRATSNYRLSLPAPTREELGFIDRALLEYDAAQASPDPAVAEYRGVIQRLLRGPDLAEREQFVRESFSTSSEVHGFYEALSEEAKRGVCHALLRLREDYRLNVSEFLRAYLVQYLEKKRSDVTWVPHLELKEAFATRVLSTISALADREVRGFKRLFMPTARDGKLLSREQQRLFSSLAELEAALDVTTLQDYVSLQMSHYQEIVDWQGTDSLNSQERGIYEAMKERGYPVERQIQENTAGVSVDMLCQTQNGTRAYIEVKSNDMAVNPDHEQLAKMAVQAFRIAHLLEPGDRLEYHFKTRRGIGIQPDLLRSMTAVLESTGVPYVIRIIENGNPERVHANLRSDEAVPRMPRVALAEALSLPATHILPFPPYQRKRIYGEGGNGSSPAEDVMATPHPESEGVVMIEVDEVGRAPAAEEAPAQDISPVLPPPIIEVPIPAAPVLVPEASPLDVREPSEGRPPSGVSAEVPVPPSSVARQEVITSAQETASVEASLERDVVDCFNHILMNPENSRSTLSISRGTRLEELRTRLRRDLRDVHQSFFFINLQSLLADSRTKLSAAARERIDVIRSEYGNPTDKFVSNHKVDKLIEIVLVLTGHVKFQATFEEVLEVFRVQAASAPEMARANIVDFIRNRASDLLALRDLQEGYDFQSLGDELNSLSPDRSLELNPDVFGDWSLSVLQLRSILGEHMSVWNAWINQNSVVDRLDWIIAVHQAFAAQVARQEPLAISTSLEEQGKRLFSEL